MLLDGVLRVEDDVGDRVYRGQLLGEMEPVDLDSRIEAEQAAIRRATATTRVAEAQVEEAAARQVADNITYEGYTP